MSVQMQTQISHACDNDCTSSVLMLGLEWSDCPFCLKYFISLLLKIFQVRLGPARQEGGGVRTEAAAQGPLPDQCRASGWPRRAKWSGLGEADLHHQGRGHRPSPVASKPRLSRYSFNNHKLMVRGSGEAVRAVVRCQSSSRFGHRDRSFRSRAFFSWCFLGGSFCIRANLTMWFN